MKHAIFLDFFVTLVTIATATGNKYAMFVTLIMVELAATELLILIHISTMTDQERQRWPWRFWNRPVRKPKDKKKSPHDPYFS